VRILVVGGTSNLARALEPHLTEFAEVWTAGRAGCDVDLDLGKSGSKFILPNGVDVVINTAASFGGKNVDAFLEAEQVNILGLLGLCQACVDAKVGYFLHVSSIFAALAPTARFFSIYSATKRHGEDLARLFCQPSALALGILRPSQFYGVGDAYRKHQPFLYSVMDRAERGEAISIYGGNDALRNFIHVEDLARIISLTVRQRLEGTYSCQSLQDVRYSEVAKAAMAAFGSDAELKFNRDQPDIPDNVFEIDGSLYELLGYSPSISIGLGMQKEAAYRKGIR